MLNTKWIVGSACIACALVLAACGQKGPLVLPQEAASQNYATLPQVLKSAGAASAPASPASAAGR